MASSGYWVSFAQNGGEDQNRNVWLAFAATDVAAALHAVVRALWDVPDLLRIIDEM